MVIHHKCYVYIFIWYSPFTFSCLYLPPCLSGCLDMVAIEGQFTFTAERPQLNCAVFFIGEPSDIISIEYDSVNIDCRGGDFIKVKCSHMHIHNSSPTHLTPMLFCSLEHKKECNSSADTYFIIQNSRCVYVDICTVFKLWIVHYKPG